MCMCVCVCVCVCVCMHVCSRMQAHSEGVAPVASRYSYELAQKSPVRSEINPSACRLQNIFPLFEFELVFKKTQMTFFDIIKQ